MYALRKTHNHYVLEPSINVAIDLGKTGIFSIPINRDSNIERLADNFVIDHKLNEEAKQAIVELLRAQQVESDLKQRKENRPARSNNINQIARQNEIHYSKFKDQLNKNPSQKDTSRKSVTPLKTLKCDT